MADEPVELNSIPETAEPTEAVIDIVDPLPITSQLSEAIAEMLSSSFEELANNVVSRLQGPADGASTDAAQEARAASQSLAPFHVPYSRNPNFFGRFTALNQLFGMWNPGEKGRIAVVGLGGIGKTELVIEFVYRVQKISPATPISWFRTNDLRITDASNSDSAAGVQLEEWLKGTHSPNSLLVVDPGVRFRLLLDEIPGYGRLVDKLQTFPGTVILLARSVQNGRELVFARDVCEISDLEMEASVDLFRHNLETNPHIMSNEKQIQEIAGLLTCLPRAIIQAAQVVNCTSMKASQFLDLYQMSDQFKIRLFSKIDPVSRPSHDISVIGKGVFDIKSFRKKYHKFCQFLFQLYYLGGTSVPKSIFSASDPLDMIITLFLIKGHFLVVEDLANQTYTMHPLVYLAIRNALEGERSPADEDDLMDEDKWYEDTVLAFSQNYPDSKSDHRAWWKECFTHLVTGYDLHNDALKTAVATIYYRESTFFKRKGMYVEALKMGVLARTVLPDPIPVDQIVIVQNQVSLFELLAKYRDMHHALQGNFVSTSERGTHWKKRMQAKLEQADCANRYETAVETFKHLLHAGEGSHAPKIDVTLAMDDLAQILMYNGNYCAATVECRKALAERKASLGSSAPETLTSCHNLADILRRDCKFDEALRYIGAAIIGRESILGADHPETMHSKVIKASILIAKGCTTADFDEAETLLTSCIEKLINKLSATHPLVIYCKSEVAAIMFARGNYDIAEQMNQSALAVRQHGPWLDPATHPDTLTSKHQLSCVLYFKTGPNAADSLSETCLAERTAVLTNGTLSGTDFHPDQLASLHHRAIILSALGQHAPALQKIDLALTGRRAILGDSHPDTLLSLTYKGEILRTQLPHLVTTPTTHEETLSTIESLHKQALDGLTLIFGPEHQSTLQCATHLALLKASLGSPAKGEAEDLFRGIYKVYQRSVGDLHPATLRAKGRLADAMRASSSENMESARKLWRESTAGWAKAYGFEARVTQDAFREYERFLRIYEEK